MTGTAAEVTPVRSIDDLHYQVGPVTSQLMEDFRAATMRVYHTPGKLTRLEVGVLTPPKM